MKIRVLVLSLVILLISCPRIQHPIKPTNFNFVLTGYWGNCIDTFHKTYTKDLILDGKVTIPLALSDSEMTRIWDKLIDIDFFSYPDTLIPQKRTAEIQPYTHLTLLVQSGSITKNVYWTTKYANIGSKEKKLFELVHFIQHFVEINPQYSKLPPARGFYL